MIASIIPAPRPANIDLGADNFPYQLSSHRVTHLLIHQSRFELIIRREPHTGLDCVADDYGCTSCVESTDSPLRDRLSQSLIRAQGLSVIVIVDLTFPAPTVPNCNCVLSDSKGKVMKLSTPPAIAPAVRDASGFSFSLPLDMMYGWKSEMSEIFVFVLYIMPADRRPRAGPSTPRPNTNPAGEKHKPQPLEQRNGDGIPGISKLKASIRQTKRFLAKVLESRETSDFLGRARTRSQGPNSAQARVARGGSGQGGEKRSGDEEWVEISYGESTQAQS